MKPSQIISTVALLSACTSAWPWPPSIPESVHGLSVHDWIGKRQDNNNNGANNNGGGGSSNVGNNNPPPSDNNNSNQSGNASPASSGGPTPTDNGGNKPTGTGAPAITDAPKGDNSTGNGNGDSKGNGTITNGPTSTKLAPIDLQDPQGGISMISPNALAGAVYYKIGAVQPITWKWNYTSLLRSPAAIDVLATASAPTPGVAAPSPFTIAANLSFQATQTVTWDTEKFTSSQPLPMGTYTLIVYDANAKGGMTAYPRPGYLGTYEQFMFGMYYPQERVDLANPYVCATCNAAGGNMERLTLGFLFTMCGLTVASFLWFTGGLAGGLL